MAGSLGIVFSVGADRATYLSRSQIAAYRDLAGAFQANPTVAGPPLDRDALGELTAVLAAALDASSTAEQPLSAAQARQLDLIHTQNALRGRLPLRIHRTCTACGTKKIINPARPNPPSGERSEGVASALVGLASMADDPVGGFLELMKGVSAVRTTAPRDVAICDYCEGFDFDLPAVTFCPQCKALRTESVLLTCPDCHADFAGADDEPLWTTLAAATASAGRTDVVSSVTAAAAKLGTAPYPEQLKALIRELTAQDRPHCLFRSSRPGDSTRSTVALATAQQLIFVKETMAGKPVADHVRWTDVLAVRQFLPARTGKDATIQLDRASAAPVVFSRIAEVGVNIEGDGPLDPLAVGHVLSRLAGVTLLSAPENPAPPATSAPTPAPAVASSSPTAPVVASPSPAAPVSARATAPTLDQPPAALTSPPPPPPGGQPNWYPDPWGQARLRWWDGQAWTANVTT